MVIPLKTFFIKLYWLYPQESYISPIKEESVEMDESANNHQLILVQSPVPHTQDTDTVPQASNSSSLPGGGKCISSIWSH